MPRTRKNANKILEFTHDGWLYTISYDETFDDYQLSTKDLENTRVSSDHYLSLPTIPHALRTLAASIEDNED